VLVREYAARWRLPPTRVLVQALSFAFALPVPAVPLLVAALFPPMAANAILTAGGRDGALH